MDSVHQWTILVLLLVKYGLAMHYSPTRGDPETVVKEKSPKFYSAPMFHYRTVILEHFAAASRLEGSSSIWTEGILDFLHVPSLAYLVR